MKKFNYVYPFMSAVMLLSSYLLMELSWVFNTDTSLIKLTLFFGMVSILITLWNYACYLFSRCVEVFEQFKNFINDKYRP